MIDDEPPVRTDSRHARMRLSRPGRLSRRVMLPLTVLVLLAALTVTGYSRLAGASASAGKPFPWDGSSAHIAGGQAPGTYTTCDITPEHGQRRVVEVPGSSGGLVLEPWFEGTAKLTCGRSVMITTGWQSTLYPYVSRGPLLLGLAALAVLAWWFGRMPRARLHVRDFGLWVNCGAAREDWSVVTVTCRIHNGSKRPPRSRERGGLPKTSRCAKADRPGRR